MGQLAQIEFGWFGIVLARTFTPGRIECSVADAGGTGGIGVDITGVPVCIAGDQRVRSASVGVDPRDHPVIAILETCVDGVDMVCVDQGMPQQVVGAVCAELPGIGSSNRGDNRHVAGN